MTADVLTRPEALRRAPARRRAGRWWFRAIGPVALLVIWELASVTGLLHPRILPAPTTVAVVGWELIQTGELQRHLLVSLGRVAAAVAIGVISGVVLALVTGLSRIGDALLDPVLQALRTIPVLALVPLFIIWFGIGEQSKVLIVALGVLFPVYLNTYAGIRNVDRKLVEVADTVGLRWHERITAVVLPGAMPSFLAGLRYAIGVAWLLLVISEQVNASSGIGYLMNNARTFLRTDVIVLGIFIYAAAGLVSDALVRMLERRYLGWRQGLEAR